MMNRKTNDSFERGSSLWTNECPGIKRPKIIFSNINGSPSSAAACAIACCKLLFRQCKSWRTDVPINFSISRWNFTERGKPSLKDVKLLFIPKHFLRRPSHHRTPVMHDNNIIRITCSILHTMRHKNRRQIFLYMQDD